MGLKLFGEKKSKTIEPTFEIVKGKFGDSAMIHAIKCKQCGSVSYNQNDVKYKYCPKCKMFHT